MICHNYPNGHCPKGGKSLDLVALFTASPIVYKEGVEVEFPAITTEIN